MQQLNWKLDPCERGREWKIKGESVQGRPLVYAEFGERSSRNTTLVLATVHGDEITPLYIGFQLVQWLKENERALLKTSRVVVAPLINPDGFFREPKTRMNARGVDVNRNFGTRDWGSHALTTWKTRFKSDPRRFPGREPGSEPETLFQEELIREIKPRKILSIHAPYNLLDYDGPSVLSLERFSRDYVKECLKLRSRLKAVSTGFYPGSLGNYAGKELGIPTLTLELPSSDPKKARQYWVRFKRGIRQVIEFSLSQDHPL